MDKTLSKAPITIAAADYEKLAELVETTRVSMPEWSRYLEQELERARVVSRADPASVQMGSSVRFHDHGSDRVHDVRLVYPADSSIADGRLSVLTPVGSALLGERAGATALCRNAAGHVRSLTVMSVVPPDGIQ
jgi:regulator of nucleoside diphosphate kinase